MSDPRRNPSNLGQISRGDVAFFVLVDLGMVDYHKSIGIDPKEFEQRGVYAYFEWVAQDNNRQVLYARVKEQIQ